MLTIVNVLRVRIHSTNEYILYDAHLWRMTRSSQFAREERGTGREERSGEERRLFGMLETPVS